MGVGEKRPRRQRSLTARNGTAATSSTATNQHKRIDGQPEDNSTCRIKKIVKQHVSRDFLEQYQRSSGEERWRMLIKVFDDVWEECDQLGVKQAAFPMAVAARIREALGQMAPGNVPGAPRLPVPPGFRCLYKAQLALLGIHSQPGVGISSSLGTATAIVVNGGYADDVDRGALFIYVGEGGEDTGDSQKLGRGNHALLCACKMGIPVRVVRGYKAHSRYAPKWGFRYDGLYKIITAYNDIGHQDRRVWKFVFQSVDPNFSPPLCGCSESRVINHDWAEDSIFDDESVPNELRPAINAKLRSGIDEHSKNHKKAQAEKLQEPVRDIMVISPNTEFIIRTSQFIKKTRKNKMRSKSEMNGTTNDLDEESKVDDNKVAETKPVFKLPKFRSFVSPLKKCDDHEWLSQTLPLWRCSDVAAAAKPFWAKFKFLPFQLRLTTKINGTIEVITLPINYELGKEFALQYFPQSVRDGVKAELVLEPPFDPNLNPWSDICQGKEKICIPCYNDVDASLPPTDFTYIRRSIAFFDCCAGIDNVCSGCIPSDVDKSQWIPVPRENGQHCPGLRDPETGRVYCYGTKSRDRVVIGDCSSDCPCQADYCTNRHWKDGVQFKLSVRRRVGVGWGVFAEESIPANTFIMEYAGDIVHFGELMARVHKYESNGKHNYCFEIYDGDVADQISRQNPCLDSLYFGNISRFINHSCEPNCAPHPHHHSGNGGSGLSLFSQRDIEAGEELNYDYGPKYTDGLECLCGSLLCRKYIHENEDKDNPTAVEIKEEGDEGSDEERKSKRRRET